MVTLVDIVIVAHPHATLGPGTHFADIVLEAPQRIQRAFENHHVVAQHSNRIVEIHPGAAATRHDLYVNRRAEYFSDFRDWVYDEGCLPNDPKLRAEMLGMMYSLDRHEQRVKIEAKEDMKKRGLSSPDRADMLALTFAVKIPRRDLNKVRVAGRKPRAKIDYDPFDV